MEMAVEQFFCFWFIFGLSICLIKVFLLSLELMESNKRIKRLTRVMFFNRVRRLILKSELRALKELQRQGK